MPDSSKMIMILPQHSNTRLGSIFIFLVLLFSLHGGNANSDETSDFQRFQYFEKHVRPLLESRCLECHSVRSDDLGGNLLLDSRDGWLRGGDLGPAIVPGKPDDSLLIQAVRHSHGELTMPPDEKLSKSEVRILVDWVTSGAPDPRTTNAPITRDKIDIEKGREHWAFQSPHKTTHPLPIVHDQAWPSNSIDFFILAQLERNKLFPVHPADKQTLIRRATFDLTGLPPTPEEVQEFLVNDAPNAYEMLLDRLLASPRYGERWGRFWLDVARYADSNGLDENIAHGNAWRFRDYVIASFNRDKPFDRFVLEQLAGDLLPKSDLESIQNERAIATGFLSLGPKVLAEVDENKMEMDIIDEQVETVGRAFMALTIGCARCHDHKFDPITTEDYYGLAGIFKSTKTMEHFTKIARWNEVNVSTATVRTSYARISAEISKKKAEYEQLKSDTVGNAVENLAAKASESRRNAKLNKLKEELSELEKQLPHLELAMAVSDYDQATDLRVHVRGSFLSQTDVVPRRFPTVLVSRASDQPHLGNNESGRMHFAKWLVDGQHPLVARVMVNRLWRWHFGKGLVESTDNFGKLGSQPQNQSLLDWLAVRFVKENWSIKRMHRLIMLSSTYRMSARHDESNASKDEENRFQWRANVRRLEAEAIRDAVLFVSGRLDSKMGGSMLHVKNREFLFDHTSKDQTNYASTRRSVYLPVIRNHLYDAFQLFDFSDASVMNSNRSTTTVAPQALFMMNSELVTKSAIDFANKVCKQHVSDRDRIDLAYRMAFGRLPTDSQREGSLKHLVNFQQNDAALPSDDESIETRAWRYFCQTLLMSNEFIYIP